MKYQDFKEIIDNFMFNDKYISLAVLNGKTGGFYSNMVNNENDCKRRFNLLDNPQYSNYISLNTFNSDDRNEENVYSINGFMFDFDDGDMSKIDKILNELGSPTFSINTTPSMNKWQFIYLFKEPIINPTKEEMLRHKQLSKTLTDYFQSDHTYDLSRVFRFPNSVNHKNGETSLATFPMTKQYYKYFLNFIEKNNIKLCDINDVISVKKTTKKTNKQLSSNKGIIRGKNKEYEDLYDSYMIKNNNDNSKSRYSFIMTLINKRLNNTSINSICDNLGFPIEDTQRILFKLGR